MFPNKTFSAKDFKFRRIDCTCSEHDNKCCHGEKKEILAYFLRKKDIIKGYLVMFIDLIFMDERLDEFTSWLTNSFHIYIFYHMTSLRPFL